MTADTSRPLSILVCALGGEGGGVLAEWIVRDRHAVRPRGAEHVDSRRRAAHRRDDLLHRDRARGRRPRAADRSAGLQPLCGPGRARCADRIGAARGRASGRRRLRHAGAHARHHVEPANADDAREDAARRWPGGYGAADAVAARLQPQAGRVRDVDDRAAGAARRCRRSCSARSPAAASCRFRARAYEETIRRFGRGTEASLAGFARGYAQLADAVDASAAERSDARAPRRSLQSRRVVSSRSAADVRARTRAPRRVSGRALRRAVPRARVARSRRRASGGPRRRARFRGDARSRALSRVVDGVRRRRPRRRSQEPRIAHRARAQRSEGVAGRRASRLRSLQARRSRACGFAAGAARRCAEALGSRRGWREVASRWAGRSSCPCTRSAGSSCCG